MGSVASLDPGGHHLHGKQKRHGDTSNWKRNGRSQCSSGHCLPVCLAWKLWMHLLTLQILSPFEEIKFEKCHQASKNCKQTCRCIPTAYNSWLHSSGSVSFTSSLRATDATNIIPYYKASSGVSCTISKLCFTYGLFQTLKQHNPWPKDLTA